MQVGQFGGAESIYRDLLHRNPENHDYYYGLLKALRLRESRPSHPCPRFDFGEETGSVRFYVGPVLGRRLTSNVVDGSGSTTG